MEQRSQEENNQFLLNAVSRGDPNFVAYALNLGADKNVQNKEGKTAVMLALENGYFLAFDMLVRYGASVMIKDNAGHTCLDILNRCLSTCEACHVKGIKKQIQKVENLIKIGGAISPQPIWDCYSQSHLDYDLCYLAEEGDIDAVKSLLNQGANIFHVIHGNPVLTYFGCEVRRYDVIEYATETQNRELVDFLKQMQTEYQTFTSAVREKNLNLMAEQIKKGVHPMAFDKNGTPALVVASQMGWQEGVDFLLDKKIDPNVMDKDGQTPLIVATKNGHEHLVKHLLEAGAERKIVDKLNNNALYYAAENGNQSLTEILVDWLDAYSVDSALYIARKNGHKQIESFLENEGQFKDVDIKPHLNAELINLIRTKNIKHAKELIEKGASVNAKILEEPHYSALQVAIMEGQTNFAKLLIEKGADVNYVNESGDTPLISAIYMLNKEMVQLLLDKGATVISEKGINAMDVALFVIQNSRDGYDVDLGVEIARLIHQNERTILSNQGVSFKKETSRQNGD